MWPWVLWWSRYRGWPRWRPGPGLASGRTAAPASRPPWTTWSVWEKGGDKTLKKVVGKVLVSLDSHKLRKFSCINDRMFTAIAAKTKYDFKGDVETTSDCLDIWLFVLNTFIRSTTFLVCLRLPPFGYVTCTIYTSTETRHVFPQPCSYKPCRQCSRL